MANRVDVQYVRFYTDGSAAKKIAPAFPESKPVKMPRAKSKKRRLIAIDPVAILSLAVCLALVITLGIGVGKLQKAKQDNLQMARYVEQLSSENETLAQTYAAGYDLHEIEKTALALGMVHSEDASHRGIGMQLDAQSAQLYFLQSIAAVFENLFA